MLTQTLTRVEQTPKEISKEDIELIKKTVAAGATEPEFRLFMYIAQRYNLDPLVKQIWLIKYGTAAAAIFTSRDGFLSIAHRSGHFDGMETLAVRNDKEQVVGAVCRVWRNDMTHPFSVEVSRSEYDTNKGNWSKMPETMIKKVAESQCLRRAFDISGLYDPSEYDPSDNAQAQAPAMVTPNAIPAPIQAPAQPQSPKEVEKISQNGIDRILSLAGTKGMDEIDLAKLSVELYGRPVVDLDMNEGRHFYQVLQGK
jgi:phage recombination protein Bet